MTYVTQLFCRPLRCGTTSKGSHSEDLTHSKLNMELFPVLLVYSCSVVLSLCSVPSASDRNKDIIKKMETCQEGNNSVSKQSVTRSFFRQLSPKSCKKRGDLYLFDSRIDFLFVSKLITFHNSWQFLDPMICGTDESQDKRQPKCMASLLLIALKNKR